MAKVQGLNLDVSIRSFIPKGRSEVTVGICDFVALFHCVKKSSFLICYKCSYSRLSFAKRSGTFWQYMTVPLASAGDRCGIEWHQRASALKAIENILW